MACKLHRRRIALRRKLQILRILTKSKSVKKSSIIMDASLYICKLMLQIEAIKKEYQHIIDHVHEVKVENIERDYILVKVRWSKKGEEMVVWILEAFEEMNLEVVEARKALFGMEFIVKAPHHINPHIIYHTIFNLLQMHSSS